MKTQILSFRCTLTNKLGQVVSSSVNNDIINELEEGSENLKGLVAGLQNVSEGETRRVFVPADQAYGLYDPELVFEISRNRLSRGEKLVVGNEVLTKSTEDGHVRAFRVIDAAEDAVVLDGNHPLAGQDLTFEIEIIAARAASVEDFLTERGSGASRVLH